MVSENDVLTAEAVEFLTELVTRFTPQRNKLLAARIHRRRKSITASCQGLFRKLLPFATVNGKPRNT
ncbi:hypothetical protein ACNKHS_24080 [Shigella flexneri]